MKNVSTEKSGRRFPLILITLLASGTLIRIINLGNIIFYWDEPLHSVRIAYQPLSFVLSHNDGSAFFALCTHFLLSLGKLEVMARLTSVVFGVIAVAAVFFLGKILISRKAGLIAAALVTFSPVLIQYSQYSRMYATYSAFSLLTVYFFYRAITENRTVPWALFSVSIVLNAYNHIFSLFVLPVFGLFTLITWLVEGIQKRPNKEKPFHPKKIFRFAAWTLAALLITGLLYIPDIGLRDYVAASMDQAVGPVQQGVSSFVLIQIILKELFNASSPAFLLIFLGLAGIGLLSSLRTRFRECLFILLYLLVPFIIFVLIRPNEAAVLSAGRYFLFLLPVLFIFTGQGILSSIRWISRFISRLKPGSLNKTTLQNALAIITVILLIGRGFDIKSYYSDYWKLGSVKVEPEVTTFLEHNLKHDAFVLIDEVPASSLMLAMNPLTKDLTLSQIEHIIRNNLVVTEKKHPVMIIRTLPNWLKYFSHKKIDFWVITPHAREKELPVLPLIPDITSPNIFLLENHLLLGFLDQNQSLHYKMEQALTILRSIHPNLSNSKDYHYLTSWIRLLMEDLDGSLSELNKALEIDLPPEETGFGKGSVFSRALNSIFNMTPAELRRRHDQRFHEAIAYLLLSQGDKLRNSGKTKKAVLAYRTCTKLSITYHEQVSIRLGFLANKIFRKGQVEESIPYYKEAIRLNPQRYDLMFMLAESLSRTGKQKEAKKTYQNVFGLEALPPRTWKKLLQTDPLVLIWKKDNIFFMLFRSQKGGTLRGEISCGSKIKNVEKYMFVKSDHADLEKNRLFLDLTTNKGTIKLISFQSAGKSRVTFDLLVNNDKKNRNIVVVNTGQNPTRIPFTWRF